MAGVATGVAPSILGETIGRVTPTAKRRRLPESPLPQGRRQLLAGAITPRPSSAKGIGPRTDAVRTRHPQWAERHEVLAPRTATPCTQALGDPAQGAAPEGGLTAAPPVPTTTEKRRVRPTVERSRGHPVAYIYGRTSSVVARGTIGAVTTFLASTVGHAPVLWPLSTAQVAALPMGGVAKAPVRVSSRVTAVAPRRVPTTAIRPLGTGPPPRRIAVTRPQRIRAGDGLDTPSRPDAFLATVPRSDGITSSNREGRCARPEA